MVLSVEKEMKSRFNEVAIGVDVALKGNEGGTSEVHKRLTPLSFSFLFSCIEQRDTSRPRSSIVKCTLQVGRKGSNHDPCVVLLMT